MNLYIDTEFNGFGGPLISIAIVSADGDQFYEVVTLPNLIQYWVKQNVLPVLNKEPIRHVTLQHKLWQFMSQFPDANIYADWPEDIAYLAKLLCAREGKSLEINLTFHLIKSGTLYPEVPHNALSGAIALKEWHLYDQGLGAERHSKVCGDSTPELG